MFELLFLLCSVLKVEEEEKAQPMVCLALVFFFSVLTPRVPWNVFDQVFSFGLEASIFCIIICMLRFFNAIPILRHAICILRCNIDSFLLNEVVLGTKCILPKILCNIHIAHRNMHFAIESILPLTYAHIYHSRH